MKSLRYLVLAMLLLVVSSCRDHRETIPDEVSEILGLKIDRALEVVLASPQGATSGPKEYQSITVVFNQPMKELSAGAGSLSQPFRIEPKVDGTFRWKGAATVSFEPKEPLPYGTEFTVTVPAGLAAPDKKTLEKDYLFKFTTPGPQLLRTVPLTGTQDLRPDQPIFFIFDQPVEPEGVKGKLRVTSPVKGVALEVRKVTPEELEQLNRDRDDSETAEESQVVVVIPSGLGADVSFALTIDSGLRGLGGPLSSAKTELFEAITLSPLEFYLPDQSKPVAPEDGVLFSFNNNVSAEALKKNVTFSPPLTLSVSSYDADDVWTKHSLYPQFEPNTAYTVTLSKELTDSFGQKLGQDVTFTWKTGDRASVGRMPEGIAVLEAQGPLTLPLELRNIDRVTYRLGVLDRAQLVEQLVKENTDWLWGNKPHLLDRPFTVEKSFKPDGPLNQTNIHPLELKEALNNRKFGFIYYQVEMKGRDGEVFSRRGLVQVTNLAVTGKFSPENSLIAATALHSGKPLGGIEASILDPKGRPVWRGVTGKSGLIEGPGWSELLGDAQAAEYAAPPLFVFLKNGQDEAFVQNSGFGEVYTWNFDITRRWASSSHYLTAQVYSERGLYRPGEQVHLRGSLRDRKNDRWSLPELDELSFEVYDSRDQKVDQGTVKLSEFGTFHHTLKLSEKAPTGAFRVDYKIDRSLAERWNQNEQVVGATFRVEEFEAAQFKVEVSSEHQAAVMGQEFDCTVTAQWLFGSPMVGSSVDWKARVEPSVFTSKEHPGFHFGPSYTPEDETDDTKVISQDRAVTGSDGKIQAKFKLEGIPYQGDADLVVEGTVQSANRRSITGSLTLPLSRGEFRVGLKAASTFIPSGRDVVVEFVTLTPDGKAVQGKSLQTELIRREWNSVKKTDVDGRFRWITEIQDRSVWKGEARSSLSPKTFTVLPKEPGYYVVRATAQDSLGNKILSETSFYSHGTGSAGWSISDDDVVELVSDKPSYQPGETAKVLVKNVFSGEVTALVTYERDKVLHSYTTTLTGGTPILEIPLLEEHIPNLFVSVMLFRGRVEGVTPNGEIDEGKPAFKIGYLDLKVTPDSKRLKVSIETEKKRYGPKDEVVAELTVTDSSGKPVKAELSVTAADVGVLNLIDFKTPDLFDTYYGALPLAVHTSESRRDVIGQRSYGAKGENQGGGGGYNPGFRKDFKLTAVWEPSVVTDASGKAQVRFELPENLTTFRIMATAITADTRCGSAEREIINTKPLVLKPSSPTFSRLGDEFEAGVLLVNSTDTGTNVTLEMTSDGVTASPTEPRQVYLKAKEEREVLFKFKAEKAGTATLRFAAQSEIGNDGVEYTIDLVQQSQAVHLAQTGYLDESGTSLELEVPSSVHQEAQLTIDLSSTVLAGLESGVRALLDYPYGCLEQRLSRMTPLLYADQLVTDLEIEGWNSEKVKVTIQESLDQIPTYLHTNGGLKSWPDSTQVHPLLTARALKIATLAEKRGYKVTGTWTQSARGYLKSYLETLPPDTLELSEAEILECRAATLDALTERGFTGGSYFSNLMDKRSKMTAASKASLLKVAVRLDDKSATKLLAQELTNSIKLENATAYFEVDEAATPWLYSSDVRDTGLILEALLSSEQPFPVADKVVTWLLEARRQDGSWGTTANNASALSALVAYRGKFEGKDPEFKVSSSLNATPLSAVELSKKSPRASLENSLSAGKHNFEIKKSGQGRLYYTVVLSYLDRTPSPPMDQGLTVLRSVTDIDGKPVTEFQGGQLYKVNLSVIAPNLRRYVVLEDPIPAGFSVVKTDFATESSDLAKLLERSAQPSWMTFLRFEDYADKVILFADALAPGEHTYQYLVRATTPGTYLHPAAQAEEMYHPELFGRTAVKTITVK